MDKKNLDKICEQVYKKFPEVAGKRPKMQPRPNGEQLLIFTAKVKLESGMSMQRTVRVVVDENGNIRKMTTSR